MPGNANTADADWQKALDIMSYSMPKRTFDFLLKGSRVVEADGDHWTVEVRQPRAPVVLSQRQAPIVRRALDHTAPGREIEVGYLLKGQPANTTRPQPAKPTDSPPPRSAGTPAPPRSPAAPAPPGSAGAPALNESERPPNPGSTNPESKNALSANPESKIVNPKSDLLSFDPNSASGGGFWKMGNYATWFWASLLGPVAWRVYELVVSDDKRRYKTLWTPPRRYSVSELARAVASGRHRRPNRDQIRGRYRKVSGRRAWCPGAFDFLVTHSMARIDWHRGDCAWLPWRPGGGRRSAGDNGSRPAAARRPVSRRVYRLSVVTRLPLLTPLQVAMLPPERQVAHERYLADRGFDIQDWELIQAPALAGLEEALT